jgi:hypothetical protein
VLWTVVRGAGGADITIHGPPGCMDIYDATKSRPFLPRRLFLKFSGVLFIITFFARFFKNKMKRK